MFRFKQFTIQQDRTAMKVCTDACILGAYADMGLGGHLLDIGTGTGLLALMAAQRNPTARVDAVELDEAAAGQATENTTASPFNDRVRVVQSSIQAFAPPHPAWLYDRILSNPPFYTRHLRSPDATVNRALHNDELPFEELISSVVRLLTADGQFWVLLPPSELERLTRLARAGGLFPFRRLLVRHNARKPVFREIAGFGFEPVETVIQDSLAIYEPTGNQYTEAFRQLLQPFYLIF